MVSFMSSILSLIEASRFHKSRVWQSSRRGTFAARAADCHSGSFLERLNNVSYQLFNPLDGDQAAYI